MAHALDQTIEAAEAALAAWAEGSPPELLDALAEYLGDTESTLTTLPAKMNSTVKAMALIGLLRATRRAGVPADVESFVVTHGSTTRITGGN